MHTEWNDVLSRFERANASVLAAASAYNKIAFRTRERIARRQLDTVAGCLDAATEQLRHGLECRDAASLLQGQSAMTKAIGEQMLSAAEDLLHIQAEARDELMRLVNESVQAVAEPAAAPAAKPAPRRRRAAASTTAARRRQSAARARRTR